MSARSEITNLRHVFADLLEAGDKESYLFNRMTLERYLRQVDRALDGLPSDDDDDNLSELTTTLDHLQPGDVVIGIVNPIRGHVRVKRDLGRIVADAGPQPGCTPSCSERHTYTPPCEQAGVEWTSVETSDPVDRATSALTEAHDLIYGERARAYGDARQHFTDVAMLWQGVLDVEVTAEHVAACMALLKIARMKIHLHPSSTQRVPHDSIVDAAGYIGLIEKMQK